MIDRRLSPVQRTRLEQRRDELEAELRQVKAELAADTSARLREQVRAPKPPTLERGEWRSGKWHPK
jgi:hypothetical protein